MRRNDPWNDAIEAAAQLADDLLEHYEEREWFVDRVRALARPAEPSPVGEASKRVREALLEAQLKRIRDLCAKDDDEICQTLGKALGYPWFKDDQVNFPGATEEQGVCVGDHVAATLSMDAARKIEKAEAERARLRKALEDAIEMVEHWGGYASDYFRDKHDLAGDLSRLRAELHAGPDDA
jgi:hypothetical protein